MQRGQENESWIMWPNLTTRKIEARAGTGDQGGREPLCLCRVGAGSHCSASALGALELEDGNALICAFKDSPRSICGENQKAARAYSVLVTGGCHTQQH